MTHGELQRARVTCDTSGSNQEDILSGFDLLNKKKSKLNPTWVFLDTCAIFNQCINPDLLKDIRDSSKGLRSHSNGGVTHTTQKGNYMGFLNSLETWYQPNGLANIISFHQLEKHFPITYVWKSKTFVVHTKGFNNEDGMILFKRSQIQYIEFS